MNCHRTRPSSSRWSRCIVFHYSKFVIFRRRVSIDACGEVKFKILTNLRVVRDEGSSTGWKVEVGPFGVGGFTELVRVLLYAENPGV